MPSSATRCGRAVTSSARGGGPRRRVSHRIAVIATVAGCVVSGAVPAQGPAFPTRAVTFVAPFTPGTTADTLARVLGSRLAERWGVPVVTENKPGASGVIGSDAVAKAAPDGHTLLFTATAHGTVPALNKRLPFDPRTAFAPVLLLGTSAMALVVAPQWGVSSVSEMVAAARKAPGKWNYSSPGAGSPQHLAMELLKQELDLDLVHVPYKGSAGALADVVAGHLQASVASLQTAMTFVQSGKLRMLAVLSPERQAAVPNVPTMKEAEAGADLVVETWYGVFAPAATPPTVIAKLNADLGALLRLPDVREQLARQGVAPQGGEPARLGELVRSEIARWTRVVERAGITAQ